MNYGWEFPYVSQRMPVLARNVVATSQPLASQAGLRMLAKGGNAVDAILAAAITLTVVEPVSNGIGSDAFAIIHNSGRLVGINGSGRSPASLTPDKLAGATEMPPRGWATVTVPGAVDVWTSLSRRFGSLPLQEVFAPAIEYATNGYPVSPIIARGWSNCPETFKDFPEFGQAFLPGGRAPKAGEIFICPGQADTLRAIAETGGEAMYRGELARKLAAHARATGGYITEADLAGHQSEWVEPIGQDFNGYTLHEIPPNGQGLAALIALGILEHYDLSKHPVDSADSIHVQIEAMKMAFSEAHRHIADPASMRVDVRAMLTESYLAHRAEQIDLSKAQSPTAEVPYDDGTVYLTAADDKGMMVSFIQSNFGGFGSGIVVPETGISLQNRGKGFTLDAGHPNCLAGGKRPYHTIIPGFVTRRDEAVMSFGVMGGSMQPQGHVQMMVRVCLFGQNPQAAADGPRWRVEPGPVVTLEAGLAGGVADDLRRRGHVVTDNCPRGQHGGAQLIARLSDGYCAASDSCKDGQAVGF